MLRGQPLSRRMLVHGAGASALAAGLTASGCAGSSHGNQSQAGEPTDEAMGSEAQHLVIMRGLIGADPLPAAFETGSPPQAAAR